MLDACLQGLASAVIAGSGTRELDVDELAAEISTQLASQYPQFLRLRGEVTKRVRTGDGEKHLRFHLRTKDAEVQCILFDGHWAKIDQALRPLRIAAVDLIDRGNQITVGGDLRYSPRFGQIELRVTYLDGRKALGETECARREVLARLEMRGISGQRLVLPDWPLRIGLVASTSSEGRGDFTAELQASGFPFVLVERSVPLSGAENAPRIAAIIAELGRHELDAIAIVRGGANPASFAPLDDEAVIAAIARCPVPVVCGIGHHSDEPLAQQFAAVPRSTPSAAASALINQLRDRHLALSATVQRCDERLKQARRSARERFWTRWLLAIGACSVAVAILNALDRRELSLGLVGAFTLGALVHVLWLWCRRRARDNADSSGLATIAEVWETLQALEPRTMQARASREIEAQLELLDRCKEAAHRFLFEEAATD
jgi:exodeoxyribonuclease VII large subunit